MWSVEALEPVVLPERSIEAYKVQWRFEAVDSSGRPNVMSAWYAAESGTLVKIVTTGWPPCEIAQGARSRLFLPLGLSCCAC